MSVVKLPNVHLGLQFFHKQRTLLLLISLLFSFILLSKNWSSASSTRTIAPKETNLRPSTPLSENKVISSIGVPIQLNVSSKNLKEMEATELYKVSRPFSERNSKNRSLRTRKNWSFSSSAPPFCHALVSNPLPFNKCERHRATQACVDDGSVRMLSQFNQDRYLYMNHFRHLKRRGVYLDVASNDALLISNTAFFDLCLGWDGICVEANPQYHDGLRKERNCALVPTCVSDVEGQSVHFVLASGAGGVRTTNKHVKQLLKGEKGRIYVTGNLKLNCTRVSRVLWKNNVSVVDYMSLDVEGHELTVLKGINWHRVTINVITLETSVESLMEIEKFLILRGYLRHYPVIDGRRLSLLNEDAIFVHESVAFGKPK